MLVEVKPEFKTKQVKQLSENYDKRAPDKSEIRLLPSMKGGGLCHCTLRPGKVSKAIKHKTIEEIWYFVQGRGKFWRKQGTKEKIVNVKVGTSITIPTGAHFQFRNTGNEPLCAIISTMPPWPGDQEVAFLKGYWKVK